MKYNYFGKLFMLFVALFIKMPLFGIVLLVAIGHIIDVRKYDIINRIKLKNDYQYSSESFIFLMAYFCYFLGLNKKQAINDFKIYMGINSDVNSSNVIKLFDYYLNSYISSKDVKGNLQIKVDKSIAKVKNFTCADNGHVRYFEIIEHLFVQQPDQHDNESIAIMQDIASTFNITYVYNGAGQQQQEYYSTQQNQQQQQDYHSSQKDYYNTSYSQEEYINNSSVKEDSIKSELDIALNSFGFTSKYKPSLAEVKKVYKARIVAVHPDTLRSKGLNENEIKNAEDEMVELNKAMEIIKKNLDNN